MIFVYQQKKKKKSMIFYIRRRELKWDDFHEKKKETIERRKQMEIEEGENVTKRIGGRGNEKKGTGTLVALLALK